MISIILSPNRKDVNQDSPEKNNLKNSKKQLDIFAKRAIIQKLSDTAPRQRTKYGGIAQLGERLNGIQEVSGSIPLISTTKHRLFAEKSVFF